MWSGRTAFSSVFVLTLLVLFIFLGLRAKMRGQAYDRARANELIAKADKKISVGDFKADVQLLKAAADIDPTNPRVWWKLCEGYELVEELDRAIAACQRQIQVNPDGISYDSLAGAYEAKKDYPDAIATYERAIKISQDREIYDNFVWALLRAEQYKRAISALQHSIELSPNDSPELNDALETLGATYMKLGEVHKAKEAFARVHNAIPELQVKTCALETDSKGQLGVHCAFSR